MRTIRGANSTPPGYYPCHDKKCPARKDPATGRLSGLHYHPIDPEEPCSKRSEVLKSFRCDDVGCELHFDANWAKMIELEQEDLERRRAEPPFLEIDPAILEEASQ